MHLIADVIVDIIEFINPHYWLYGHTSQQSTDKISEVILHFASNSI